MVDKLYISVSDAAANFIEDNIEKKLETDFFHEAESLPDFTYKSTDYNVYVIERNPENEKFTDFKESFLKAFEGTVKKFADSSSIINSSFVDVYNEIKTPENCEFTIPVNASDKKIFEALFDESTLRVEKKYRGTKLYKLVLNFDEDNLTSEQKSALRKFAQNLSSAFKGDTSKIMANYGPTWYQLYLFAAQFTKPIIPEGGIEMVSVLPVLSADDLKETNLTVPKIIPIEWLDAFRDNFAKGNREKLIEIFDIRTKSSYSYWDKIKLMGSSQYIYEDHVEEQFLNTIDTIKQIAKEQGRTYITFNDLYGLKVHVTELQNQSIEDGEDDDAFLHGEKIKQIQYLAEHYQAETTYTKYNDIEYLGKTYQGTVFIDELANIEEVHFYTANNKGEMELVTDPKIHSILADEI